MTTMGERYRQMEDRLAQVADTGENDGADAKPWKPWSEDSEPRALLGTLVRVAELPERDGMPAAKLAVIAPREGGEQRSVVIRHAALVRRWSEQTPAVGDLVGVVYRGKSLTQDGREYHAWHLDVDRAEPEQASLDIKDDPPPARNAIHDDDDIPF